jgi:hypothetical protein
MLERAVRRIKKYIHVEEQKREFMMNGFKIHPKFKEVYQDGMWYPRRFKESKTIFQRLFKKDNPQKPR